MSKKQDQEQNQSYYEIYDLSIIERSLVKSPAVEDAKIIIMKSTEHDPERQSKEFAEIVKSTKEGKIYGYALVPDKEDKQGEVISKEEIKKAVNLFNKNLSLNMTKGTGSGYEHMRFDSEISYPILNVYDETGDIAKAVGIPSDKIIKGAWLTGDQLTEKGLELYKSGDITGWSIGGTGSYRIHTEDSANSDDVKTEAKSFIKTLTDFFKNNKGETMTEKEIRSIVKEETEELVKSIRSELTELVKSIQPDGDTEKSTKTENIEEETKTDENLDNKDNSTKEDDTKDNGNENNNNNVKDESKSELEESVKSILDEISGLKKDFEVFKKAKPESRTNNTTSIVDSFSGSFYDDIEIEEGK